jgi:hypothetical protein
VIGGECALSESAEADVEFSPSQTIRREQHTNW